MADDPKTTNRDILQIAFEDAARRGEMWGEFAEEYVRLGLLAHAMRGPLDVITLSEQTAKACRDAMDAEIKTATHHANVLRA